MHGFRYDLFRPVCLQGTTVFFVCFLFYSLLFCFIFCLKFVLCVLLSIWNKQVQLGGRTSYTSYWQTTSVSFVNSFPSKTFQFRFAPNRIEWVFNLFYFSSFLEFSFKSNAFSVHSCSAYIFGNVDLELDEFIR